MQVQTNVSVHNRFDVEVVDSRTGKVRQRARGFNIVLDNMWTTLCNGQAFFAQIAFGQGTGTLDPARTSLFSQIASLAATVVETVKALPTSSVKKSITLPLGTYAGKTISEVGVYGSRLNTHALLEDSEGQPITIAVGEFDIVTIYATVYSTFAIENPDDMTLISMPDNNSLVNYLTGGSAPSGSFSVGEGDGAGTPEISGLQSVSLGSTSSASWTADVPNKKRKTDTLRLDTSTGNGDIMEVCFSGLFRAVLPISGVFAGQEYEDVSLGTGGNARKTFRLPSKNIVPDSVVVKVNGVATDELEVKPASDVNHRFNLPAAHSPPGSGRSLAIAGDDEVMYVGGVSAPYVSVYDVVGYGVVKRTTSNVANVALALCLCSSKNVLYVGSSQPPYLFVCDVAQDGALMARADLAVNDRPSGSVYTMTLFGDTLCVGHSNSPYLTVYDIGVDGSLTKRANLAVGNRPTSTVEVVALSPDSKVLYVGHDQSPYLTVYDIGVDGSLTKRADLAVGNRPAGDAYAVVLSEDGDVLYVGHSGEPYLTVYDISDEVLTKRADLSAPLQPSGRPEVITLNGDEDVLYVGFDNAPYLDVYDIEPDGSLTKRTALEVGLRPAGGIYAMIHDGASSRLYIAHDNSPYLTIYDVKRRASDIIFDNAPPDDTAITASYTTKGIHKTDQYVIDLSCAITFGPKQET